MSYISQADAEDIALVIAALAQELDLSNLKNCDLIAQVAASLLEKAQGKA